MTMELEPARNLYRLYRNRGVFEALDFAFRNPALVGLKEDSREYAEIARAYWDGMPFEWCMARQPSAPNPGLPNFLSDHQSPP